MSPCIRFFVEVLIAFQRALIFGVLHARRFGTSWGEVYWGSGTNNFLIISARPLKALADLSLACTVQSITFPGVHRCATNPLTPKSD